MNNNTLTELRSLMDEIVFSFVENPVPDYASYLERVGRYNGLKEAVQVVVQAQKEDDITPTF